MGALRDCLTEIEQTLAGISAPVITEPRAVRPGVVLIEPPTVTGISGTLSQVAVPVVVLAAPPGDRTAVDRMLDVVDEIIALLPVETGSFGISTIGAQELPSYSLDIRLTIRRS
jgi:hypothetical protein